MLFKVTAGSFVFYPRHRGVKGLAQGHAASQRESWAELLAQSAFLTASLEVDLPEFKFQLGAHPPCALGW